MFKRFALTLLLVFVLAVPASAADVNGGYFGLKFIDSIFSTGYLRGDGSDLGNTARNTVGGGAFLGYDFYPQHDVPIRAEVEYAIRTNATASWERTEDNITAELKGQWNVQTLFANLYLDFHNSSNFTPYIGGGAGLGFLQSKYKITATDGADSLDGSFHETKTVFAWNAGVGCSYAFTQNISADLAYRFVGLGYSQAEKTMFGEKMKIGMAPYANEFSLGMRVTF